MYLFFLDHLRFFWTLGKKNNHVTENLFALKKDQRSSLVVTSLDFVRQGPKPMSCFRLVTHLLQYYVRPSTCPVSE